jgi:hypothetical protein
MISETKLDYSFPSGQFSLDGFSTPIRLDRNKNGGGIMLFVRENVTFNLLSFENSPIECFYVELNIKRKKWLLVCSYNPNKNDIKNHLLEIGKGLDLYVSKYDNLNFLGDFNVEMSDQ